MEAGPKWTTARGRERERARQKETERERESIFPQHLWWEKWSHRAGPWMWIIEQCPAALSLGFRFTGRLWKAGVQGHITPALIPGRLLISCHDQRHDVFALACGPPSVHRCSLGLGHVPVCSVPSWLQHQRSRLEVWKLTSAVEWAFGNCCLDERYQYEVQIKRCEWKWGGITWTCQSLIRNLSDNDTAQLKA